MRFSHLIKTEVFGQDRIGTPVRQNAEYHSIDTARAAMFRRISQTRLGDLVLLQLDYSIWFPSRPCTSGFDLLCGHLDGITWRVTLLPDGKPWLQKCRGLVLHFEMPGSGLAFCVIGNAGVWSCILRHWWLK